MDFYHKLTLTELLILLQFSFFLHQNRQKTLDFSLNLFYLLSLWLTSIALLNVDKVKVGDWCQDGLRGIHDWVVGNVLPWYWLLREIAMKEEILTALTFRCQRAPNCVWIVIEARTAQVVLKSASFHIEKVVWGALGTLVDGVPCFFLACVSVTGIEHCWGGHLACPCQVKPLLSSSTKLPSLGCGSWMPSNAFLFPNVLLCNKHTRVRWCDRIPPIVEVICIVGRVGMRSSILGILATLLTPVSFPPEVRHVLIASHRNLCIYDSIGLVSHLAYFLPKLINDCLRLHLFFLLLKFESLKVIFDFGIGDLGLL